MSNTESAANYQSRQPINVDEIVHDAVMGDEITVWFAMEPIACGWAPTKRANCVPCCTT